ncbi:related to Tri201 - trichothecene 3-O-acetyltransferase [Cephalotrichum gorgonifer]|uniref:Related to Tri201 - trichothecene 3-O-acetyltransferase n=1 Tax=Cephalotrichum gorgonifer TaxID=2041049 RepID=A0AAE8MW66_9PEZI|nr:related to Tri201 - trichothecene 3-O-acetyltransferase [Cephalotrichum gorgonifer]
MPNLEELHLHPLGWENDPEEERRKLSTLDYLSAMTYNNYALFFKLDDDDKSKIAAVLKEGLERTLSQARHLVGTIEPDEDGSHSFVKRKNDTVKFVIQYIDTPEDGFPSFAEIEKANFVATTLGDINTLSNSPMTYGEKPEANPNANPVISSFKANFIPGGLIFNMHSHHYSNDVMGWGSFTKQLAENCYAIVNKSEFPTFDPKCLDRSRFTTAPVPEEARVNAPPQADRHPGHNVCQSLIFHLPKSKAALLKKAASPDDGTWISTYDAMAALAWRVFSKIREPVYNLDPASNPIWAEGVNMTKRLTDPVLPARMQGNAFFATMSAMAAVPQLSLAEIVSEAPFPRLAYYIRQLTNGCTGEMLNGALAMLAPIRNKADLSVRVNSFPPGSTVVTDWRDANVCTADFGFGKPNAFRHLFDTVTEGLIIVYPPRSGPSGDDEGSELQVAFEKDLTQQLIEDPEWSKYFEFRGVDAEDITRA